MPPKSDVIWSTLLLLVIFLKNSGSITTSSSAVFSSSTIVAFRLAAALSTYTARVGAVRTRYRAKNKVQGVFGNSNNVMMILIYFVQIILNDESIARTCGTNWKCQ